MLFLKLFFPIQILFLIMLILKQFLNKFQFFPIEDLFPILLISRCEKYF